jgi:hypothetical protein
MLLQVLIVVATVAVTGNNDTNSSVARTDDWWSIQPIQRISPPEQDSPWVRTPIDSFILAKLREKGLRPSPESDAVTLIRRVTYNLHGLPPTPEEIDAFVSDSRAGAYERLVDRLLDSPRYGERWGRHWLDVVHFGETHGYDKDKPRPNAWPYRDYVIRSLNSDKPYGKFVEQQLAGDVIEPDDPEGIVATGFIAAGPWDFVGHVELPETKTDGLIARYNDRDDMVSTAMSTFVSLTVHCARCHDHKFDPIPQRDYYRLQAVFAGVDRADRPFDHDSALHRKRRSLASERGRLQAALQAIELPIARITSPAIEAVDRQAADKQSQVDKLPQAKDASPSNGYHSAIMPGPDHQKWVQVDLGREMPIEAIKLVPARPTDFQDTPGFGFPVRYRVELSHESDFRSTDTVADFTGADQPYPGDQAVVLQVPQTVARFVRVTATRLWKRTDDFVLALAELEVYSRGKNAALGAPVKAFDSIEAGRWSTKYLVDGYSSRRRIAVPDAASPDEIERKRLEAELAELAAERRRLVEQQIEPAVRQSLAALRSSLEKVTSETAKLPAPNLVYAAASDFARQGSFAPARPPRLVHLLTRGDVKQPASVVSPGSLACLSTPSPDFHLPDPNDEGARRAALARWITDPHNPLTWRSIVNRVWLYHFGRGIVDTPNDFGRMGEEPSHPELLDWLANWFLDNGQSLKALHRLILTSSVYRQTAIADSELPISGSIEAKPQLQTGDPNSIDADNRYYWRMNRARLDAESIRDAALFVAGRLDFTMGGPSAQQFFFKDDHSPVYDYSRFDVESPGNFRRSIYRFTVRSVPDPFMECLDCADSSILTPKRNSTLTALQALSMLNDRVMVRASEDFAERVAGLGGDLPSQIHIAFRLALGRPPHPVEQSIMCDAAAQHGLSNACRVILNCNEFVFVD